MTYSSEVLADSPAIFLKFDETSGTVAADASGNARDGAYSGTYSLGATGLTEDGGTALDLRTSPGGSALRATTAGLPVSVLTVELWAKRNGNGHDGNGAGILASRDRTSAGFTARSWYLTWNDGGTVQARGFGGSSSRFIIDTPVLSNDRHHIVFTYGDGFARIYVDGTLAVSAAATGTLNDQQALAVGQAAVQTTGGLRFFNGVLDSFAMYPTALSAGRIAAHYAAGLAADTPAVAAAGSLSLAATAAATAVAVTLAGASITQTAAATVVPVYSTSAASSFAIEATAESESIGGTPLVDAATGFTLVASASSLPVYERSAASALSLGAAATTTQTYAVNGSSTLTLTATGALGVDGVLAQANLAVVATALAERAPTTAPAVAAAPNAGRTRLGVGVAMWEPPVVEPPTILAPVHARIAAHAYTSVDVVGTRPELTGLVTAERPRHRDRIVIAGRDVTYWRGVATPLPRFGLVSPLLWGSGTLELPQVAACFETPGEGDLSWLREGATVVVQRVPTVGENAGKVIATDYRGIILGFNTSGRSLTVDLGGDALGRASLRDKQPPIFKRRNDLGWWWWNALAGPEGLYRPFGKVGGPTTGIGMYDTGGVRFVEHVNELAAKGVNLAGTQWTCMPNEDGPSAGTYFVRRKDVETIHATVYLDDAHTVGSLQADAGERPNRIYGTGVTPRGERARFGVYPVLAEKQRARFPNYTDDRVIEQGDTNADTDTGGGVTALLRRLSVTGYLSTDEFAGGFDIDVTRAVRDLQEDAGLAETGKVNPATWDALFDVDVVGYSTKGSRVEPIAQRPAVRRVRRNASGQVIGQNPNYNPRRLVVDRTIDFGTGITRGQMREWARADLASETPGSTPSGNGRHWTGTIKFELGAVIDGEHNPGDPLAFSDIVHARSLRPGMNLWLPLFDGGTQVHVSGVDVNSAQEVTVSVDTRARDTMTVWEVIARNQENKRNPARAWIRDHRSSSFSKDAVTEFDEIGGTITDQELDAGWNVFPVVAGQEGTIARLRLNLDKPAEFVTAVFGRRISTKRLDAAIGNPLSHAGAKRWTDPEKLDKLVGDRVLLYVAGDDQAPCGYYPGTKETRTYTPNVPNPDYNVDVPLDSPKYNNQETLPEQIPNPNYNPADPENDQEFIDKVVTEQLTPLTGRWNDDAGFGYRTFDQSCVLWVAVYVRKARTLDGGRIMWPQLESGA